MYTLKESDCHMHLISAEVIVCTDRDPVGCLSLKYASRGLKSPCPVQVQGCGAKPRDRAWEVSKYKLLFSKVKSDHGKYTIGIPNHQTDNWMPSVDHRQGL